MLARWLRIPWSKDGDGLLLTNEFTDEDDQLRWTRESQRDGDLLLPELYSNTGDVWLPSELRRRVRDSCIDLQPIASACSLPKDILSRS